jgi:hypothetical protein
LRDPSREVRQAAGEVLFWDGERRWGWVRFSVHEALADPALRSDGPLPLGGAELPPQAVADLNEWVCEGGDTTYRTTLTLIAHYSHVLDTRADDGELVAELRRKIFEPGAPTMLRVELAQLLFEQQQLDRAALERLLVRDYPAPLRLLGADAILLSEPHAASAATLREVARMPNREIALAVAQIVQRRLGVDLGMDLQKPPAPHTRAAAEVTRRVMMWAAEVPPEAEVRPDDTPQATTPAAAHPETEWDLPAVPRQRGDSTHGPDIRATHL